MEGQPRRSKYPNSLLHPDPASSPPPAHSETKADGVVRPSTRAAPRLQPSFLASSAPILLSRSSHGSAQGPAAPPAPHAHHLSDRQPPGSSGPRVTLRSPSSPRRLQPLPIPQARTGPGGFDACRVLTTKCRRKEAQLDERAVVLACGTSDARCFLPLRLTPVTGSGAALAEPDSG